MSRDALSSFHARATHWHASSEQSSTSSSSFLFFFFFFLSVAIFYLQTIYDLPTFFLTHPTFKHSLLPILIVSTVNPFNPSTYIHQLVKYFNYFLPSFLLTLPAPTAFTSSCSSPHPPTLLAPPTYLSSKPPTFLSFNTSNVKYFQPFFLLSSIFYAHFFNINSHSLTHDRYVQPLFMTVFFQLITLLFIIFQPSPAIFRPLTPNVI